MYKSIQQIVCLCPQSIPPHWLGTLCCLCLLILSLHWLSCTDLEGLLQTYLIKTSLESVGAEKCLEPPAFDRQGAVFAQYSLSTYLLAALNDPGRLNEDISSVPWQSSACLLCLPLYPTSVLTTQFNVQQSSCTFLFQPETGRCSGPTSWQSLRWLWPH